MQPLIRHVKCRPLAEAPNRLQNLLIVLCELTRHWNCLVAVLVHHGQSALTEIAQFIGKVDIDPLDERLFRIVTIVAETNFGDEKESSLINSELKSEDTKT